jgi:hypothetical protein
MTTIEGRTSTFGPVGVRSTLGSSVHRQPEGRLREDVSAAYPWLRETLDAALRKS